MSTFRGFDLHHSDRTEFYQFYSILFLPFDFEDLKGVAMSDLDLGLFELELGLLQLSLYWHASICTNTRWRGQEWEGEQIDLEELEPESWKTYFR